MENYILVIAIYFIRLMTSNNKMEIKTISFKDWLKEKGFKKETYKKYTIEKVDLYDIFYEEMKRLGYK